MSIGRLGLIQAGQPAKQCPTLAEMTADATATAAQIAEGETAYVKGEKITGTMPTQIDVAAELISFGYSQFKTIPSCFNFSSVKNAVNMFLGCSSLTSISGIEFSSVKNATNMFFSCSSLTSISGIDFSSVTVATNMFSNCSSLINFYNTTEISCSLSFSNSSKLSVIDAETNILSYLADLTGKTSKTITFNTALEGQIGDSYIQEATSKNWVVSFAN